MLVVGAHSADFVWRAAGTIARHTSAGGEAIVVALSYGERGESGALWQEPGQTEDATTARARRPLARGCSPPARGSPAVPARRHRRSFSCSNRTQPELCGFVPTVYVDITSVIEAKQEAMSAMAAQTYLREYYPQRTVQRANHARKVTGNKQIRYAEAFQRIVPNVVNAL